MNVGMKGSWTDLEPQSIHKAIELWHELGSEEFISRTRFRESHRYVVVDRGQAIASKPLVAMAFQLQYGCGKDGPPRLSGGEQTRAILDRLGFELVDMQGESFGGTAQLTKVSAGPDTKFWWVNQSVNFYPVFGDGTLWAPLKDRRGQQVDHWRTLDRVLPGDLVIHYARPEVRAISRVATKPQPAYPPRGYDDVPADTKGTLVLTEPLLDIRVTRDEALAILEQGKGPVSGNGTLRNGYVFPLEPANAELLLRRAGVETSREAVPGDSPFGGPSGHYLGGATDRLAIVAIRAEQQFLRSQQLRHRGSSCALCGRHLPEELLIAAHVKPRWACSEEERMDSLNVSMLACLLGCDALFELGYVIVGEQGHIERGYRGSDDAKDRVAEIVGRQCPAHSRESRQYFAWHQQHHAARPGRHTSGER